MATIIDGKALSERKRGEIAEQAAAFEAAHGRAPGLAVVLVGSDPASEIYVRNKKKGCEACGHTGYAGRTGVFELLVTDDAIRAQIHAQASEAEIRTAALAAGMTLMREDGERLIAAGITSREEVLRVTRD